MNKIKTANILCTVLSFVLALLISLTALSFVFATASTKGYMKYIISSSDYTQNSVQRLKNDLCDLSIPSGLPQNFFDDKINTNILSSLTEQCIDQNYNGEAFIPNTVSLKKEIIGHLKEYARKSPLIDESTVTDQSLEYLAQSCVQEYIDVACPDIFRLMALYFGKINRYLWYGFAGLLILTIGGFVLLCKISRNTNKAKYFRYFSFCSAGITVLTVPAIILAGRYVQKISINEGFMREFISLFADTALILCIVLGILLMLGSVAFIFKLRSKKQSTEEIISQN